MSAGRVVVGTSGSEGSGAAVRYAAAEANRLDLRLEIVHVVPEYVPLGMLYPMATPAGSPQMEVIGRSILDEARDEADKVLPSDRIDIHLGTGDRVEGVLGRLEGAHALVLGDDRTPLMSRIATGSMVGAVAGRAPVPVVVVPSDWHAGEPRHRIAVGLKEWAELPIPLLHGALRLASERGAALEIVHIWDPPVAYADLLMPALAAPGWAARVEREIRAKAADLLAAFPSTGVVVSALYGDATAILQHVSTESDLIVIARRTRAFPEGHFGSTGRALLRGMQCPLVVLPVSESGEDLLVEVPTSAGTMGAPSSRA